MSRYRKIEVAVWTDERFRALTSAQANAQTLWLYLLCGPRTTALPGLVVAGDLVMAADLGWSVEAFREAFAEVLSKGMAEASWKGGMVVLSKALFDSAGEPRETARPQSPNVIRSWAKAWDEVPDCDLKNKYLLKLESFSKALGEAFAKAFAEAFRKALAKASRYPSPIQEQETGTGTGSGITSSPPAAGTASGQARAARPKRGVAASPESMQAAIRLMGLIAANTPTSTLAKLTPDQRRTKAERWTDAFRLLHERDGHSWQEIDAMIDWCQRDSFWRQNILSGDKLREKWDQLAAKRAAETKGDGSRYGRVAEANLITNDDIDAEEAWLREHAPGMVAR